MSSAEAYPLPEDALEEKFIASTGPGGQNVNRVCPLPPGVNACFKWKAD
jgi:hypothetical protein